MALDKEDYNDEELVSVKTTLNLPYFSSSSSSTFERISGSMEINGKVYDYVKRRVYHNTLELLCLLNQAKTKLLIAGNELAKSSADGQASVPAKKSDGTVKIKLSDLFQFEGFEFPSIENAVKHSFPEMNTPINFHEYIHLPDRPPQTFVQLLS